MGGVRNRAGARRLALAILAALALAVPMRGQDTRADERPEAPVAVGPTEAEGVRMTEAATLHHENGLTVPRPEGFAVERTEHGFALTEEWVRQVRRATLSFHPDEASLQAAGLAMPSGAERDCTRYAVRELGSGSAGTENELTAVREVEGGLIALRAVEQTEGEAPGFKLAWSLLEGAAVER